MEVKVREIQAAKVDLNTHADPDSEAGHQAFTAVPMQGQIAALAELWQRAASRQPRP